jgi:hypothetical protein
MSVMMQVQVLLLCCAVLCCAVLRLVQGCRLLCVAVRAAGLKKI